MVTTGYHMLPLQAYTTFHAEGLDKEPQSPVKINDFDKLKVSGNNADTTSVASTSTTPRLLDSAEEYHLSSETFSSDSESSTMEMLELETGPYIDWIDRLMSRLESKGKDLHSGFVEDVLQAGSVSYPKIPLSVMNSNDFVDDLEELGFPLWQALDVVKRCSTVEECIEMIRERGWDQE